MKQSIETKLAKKCERSFIKELLKDTPKMRTPSEKELKKEFEELNGIK